MSRQSFIVLSMAALAAFCFVGCNHSAGTTTIAEHEHHHSHDHGGWWCDEHGVPEAICARCDTKLVADFKAKNDWCKDHDRPDSQCFICHPEKEAEFAAQYEAKYGKQPPKPESDGEKHEHKEEAKS